MDSTDFIVKIPGIVHSIKQSKKRDCWAVVTTILLSWRDQMKYDIKYVTELLGSEFLKLYDYDVGLSQNNLNEWLFVSGLIIEDPKCYSQFTIIDMLKDYGPLIFTIANVPQQPFLLNAKVVTGMKRGNTQDMQDNHIITDIIDKTEVFGIDPASGMEFSVPFSEFCNYFYHQNSLCESLVQIVHLPTQMMFINNLRK